MAAPITTEQAADLMQYKDLVQYMVNILDKEATIPVPALTAGNITELNDSIGMALANTQAILAEAAFLDVTPPTVANYFPADEDVDIPIDSDLVLIFDEPMQKGTGDILIREDGITTQTIDVTTGSVTVNNNIVTITPTDFTLGVTVSVQIAAGALKDLANNNYAGISNDTTWNFDTVVP